MTGGQVSPTTPIGGYTTTSPFGNIEEAFDLSELAIIAGAPYVARWPLGYPYETIKSIKQGIQKKGFAFIEMLVPCPTGYGRKNKLREVKANWEWYKKNTVLIVNIRYWRINRKLRIKKL